MYAATAGVLWSAGERAGVGGRRHDNEVAKGSWDRSLARKGKESVHAMSSVHACLVALVCVRACACGRARDREGVGARRSIMVCPLRGNYAESCTSVGGGGGLLWDVCPLCVFARLLAKPGA